MKITETKRFRKSFTDLDKKIRAKTHKQFGIFIKNLFHPSLHTEKLEPKHKNIWSFRIDKNHRAIFTFTEQETILLLDIGPHDIYKRMI